MWFELDAPTDIGWTGATKGYIHLCEIWAVIQLGWVWTGSGLGRQRVVHGRATGWDSTGIGSTGKGSTGMGSTGRGSTGKVWFVGCDILGLSRQRLFHVLALRVGVLLAKVVGGSDLDVDADGHVHVHVEFFLFSAGLDRSFICFR